MSKSDNFESNHSLKSNAASLHAKDVFCIYQQIVLFLAKLGKSLKGKETLKNICEIFCNVKFFNS